MRKPEPLPGMRIATVDDFREDGHLIIDVEYFEFMLGDDSWQRDWTSIHTDRYWLRTKIELGYICVHQEPVLWNQNRKAFENFVLNYKKKLEMVGIN